MKTGFQLFLETSGLSVNEATMFLVMKMMQILPNADTEIDIEFIDKLAADAKRWKKIRQKPC